MVKLGIPFLVAGLNFMLGYQDRLIKSVALKLLEAMREEEVAF
jgi:hypothetical protein